MEQRIRLYYLTDTNRYFINEGLLLENPRQAVKYLKDNDLDPDTNEKGKKLFDDIHNITKGDGYTHLLLKFYHGQRVGLEELRELYDFLKTYRGDLRNLRQPPVNYDSYTVLLHDLQQLKLNKNVKNFFNKLPRHLKDDYNNAKDYIKDEFNYIVTKFIKLPLDKQEGYEWKEINRYKDIDEFTKRLKGYITAVEYGLGYDETIKQLKAHPEADLVYSNPEEKIVIGHIKTFEASQKFGAPAAWCIKDYLFRFNEYKKGNKKYFFIWDYKLPITDEYFMLAVAHKKGDLNKSIMFNKPNYQVGATTSLKDKNIDVSILDSHLDKQYGKALEIIKDIPIVKFLQENDDENLLIAIRSSQFINEYGDPDDVEIYDNIITLGIEENNLLDAFEISNDDYSELKSNTNFSYRYHEFFDRTDEPRYMHGNLNEKNILLIKKLMEQLGCKNKYWDDINEEGVILNFSETYNLKLEVVYMDEMNEEAERVVENEANNILSNIKIDISTSEISKEDVLSIIADSGGLIKTFDDVMKKINELTSEIDGYIDFYHESVHNNMDYDNLNNEIEKKLNDILDNIEDYLPENYDYTYDEIDNKLEKLGFVEMMYNVEYKKESADKTIYIREIDYDDDGVFILKMHIEYKPEYFNKINKKAPKDIGGWVDFNTLVKYVQHYTMTGIDENKQIKRMKKLMK